MSDPTPSRERERRHATVLFADISGFTALSEQTDPEELTDVLNGCFTMLEEVIHEHGGYVDKFIGDCVMAMFGLPHALEDASQRAVNAAIEIRNRLAEFSRQRRLDVPLAVHSGVNTGLVIAGDVGGRVKHDFTVMGDSVNIASRLKDAAPSGSIYVGPETYRYTQHAFEYKQLPATAIKGKQESITVYEVLSTKESLHRARPAARGRMVFSELVGRQSELDLLAHAVARAATGQGGIVSLVGEAGLGKSRLLGELRQRREVEEVTVLEGRCLSMGRSLSYHPFLDLLRHWVGITDEDREEQVYAKLEQAIVAVDAEKASELFPFVATLMGIRLTDNHAKRVEGIEGEAMEKLILKAMRDLLRAGSQLRPLVLLFEDLHWADQSSIKLLEGLLRIAAQAPVLIVNAFRPDEPDTSGRILSFTREHLADCHVEIVLAPLEAKDRDVLIQNLLQIDNLPHGLRALIARKAEGNPFYIEEVVRSLVDQGVVEQTGGKMRLNAKIDSIVIPGTIQEVIMARIDRLEEPLRKLLQTASVLGRSVYRRVLEDLVDPDTDLDRQLERLKDSQILEERRTRRTATPRRRRLTEEVEYVFKHALLQETIYESILQKTRKQLHLRVAESIEKNLQDRIADFYGMLAYHYSRAEELEKAEHYLFRAGDEAARAAATAEALSYFREASRIYQLIHGEGGDAQKKALLERNIGTALLTTGNLVESVDHFTRSLELLGERVPDTRASILRRFGLDLLAVLYQLYVRGPRRRSGRHDEHLRATLAVRYNRARAQVTSDPQRMFFDTIGTLRRMGQTDASKIEDSSGMYAGAALLFSFSGVSFGVSRKILRIAQTLMREGSVRDHLAYRSMVFLHNYLEGAWGEEHALDEALLDEGLRYGQLWDVSTYLGIECEWRIRRGDFALARRRIDKLASIRDSYGFDFTKSNEDFMTAHLLLEQRRFDEALVGIDEYYQTRPEELLNILGLGTKAKIQLLRGQYEEASESIARAKEIADKVRQVPPYHLSPLLVSECLRDVLLVNEAKRSGADARPALRAAKHSAARATKIAAKIARELPEAYQLNGSLDWLAGRHKRAMQWWTRSIQVGQRLGARPALARTYAEVADRLSAEGGPDEMQGRSASEFRQDARALLIELGLEGDREQPVPLSGAVA